MTALAAKESEHPQLTRTIEQLRSELVDALRDSAPWPTPMAIPRSSHSTPTVSACEAITLPSILCRCWSRLPNGPRLRFDRRGRNRDESAKKGATVTKLLSVNEVAELLGMSTQWVYANAGKLIPCLRIGGALRFDPDDIEEFITASRSGPEPRKASRPSVYRPKHLRTV